MKSIVIDLDGTLTIDSAAGYEDKLPNVNTIQALRNYKNKDYRIVIFTARNMKTYAGDINKIQQYTLPIIIDWLEKHDVPYDEVIIGKPWCGHEGFYVDDKAIRPSEFASLSQHEIFELLKRENPYRDGGNN